MYPKHNDDKLNKPGKAFFDCSTNFWYKNEALFVRLIGIIWICDTTNNFLSTVSFIEHCHNIKSYQINSHHKCA